MRAVAHISPCNEGKPSLPSKGKDGLFSSLLRISLLFLIVLASGESKRLLQAREIRGNDFSVAFSYPLRVSKEIRKASAQATESKAEIAALLCEV